MIVWSIVQTESACSKQTSVSHLWANLSSQCGCSTFLCSSQCLAFFHGASQPGSRAVTVVQDSWVIRVQMDRTGLTLLLMLRWRDVGLQCKRNAALDSISPSLLSENLESLLKAGFWQRMWGLVGRWHGSSTALGASCCVRLSSGDRKHQAAIEALTRRSSPGSLLSCGAPGYRTGRRLSHL